MKDTMTQPKPTDPPAADADCSQATLPKGCGYTGRDFGATYIDSECSGGQLYDLDNCDDEQRLYEPGEYLACPECNHEEWLRPHLERVEDEGAGARENGQPRVHPFVKEWLTYEKDFEQLRDAWLRGYDAQGN